MSPTVSVITPTIPPRRQLLTRAVDSIMAQTRPVDEIIIRSDLDRAGAAATRQLALDAVTTDWVVPLDDDDTFRDRGIEYLLGYAETTGADMVYGHYEVIGGTDPRPENFGKPFDPDNPVQTTIVVLSRTSLAKECGYVNPDDAPLNSPDRLYAGEDWFFIQQALRLGANIQHVPYKVFNWYHHGRNTSGLPQNW